MGSFINSILCCIGDSDEHLNDSQFQSSTSQTKSSQPTNNAQRRNKGNLRDTTSNGNGNGNNSDRKNQSDSKKSTKDPHSTTKKTSGSKSNGNSTKMQQSKSNTYMSTKDKNPDVSVYETTDSTNESANYDSNINSGVRTVSVEKNPDNTLDSDISSNEEALEEEEFYNNEFFDLTKLQPGQAHTESGWLLNPKPMNLRNRKCLILDLDETLVHSSFKYLRNADFVIPVDIENQLHNVYVIKRPGVDDFMKRVGELYEVVIFTASVSRYGDPLLDALDIHKSIHHRLFRDSCYNYQGNYIKNLSQIGRPLNEIIILDNSPASYIFHPQHAIPISSWFSDAHDNELLDIIPFLEDLAKDNVEDIGLVLDVNL